MQCMFCVFSMEEIYQNPYHIQGRLTLVTFSNIVTVTSAGKVASGLERFVVVEPAAFLCSGLQEIDTTESGQKAGRKWVESGQKAEKKQVKSGLEAG